MLNTSLRRAGALLLLGGIATLPLSPRLCLALDAGAPTAPPAGAAQGQGQQGPALVDPVVARAIDAVYPALVQIHVLTVEHMGGRERKFEAAGSGAIISENGYVVTNHHVAGKACAIKCVLSSREEIDAKLIGTDVLADIAVLKLDLDSRPAGSPKLPVAKFGRSSDLRIGDVVLAMGCPLALSHSVTKGIVANMDLMTSKFVGGEFMLDGEDVGSLVKWIGHDATIQPGNSGGPLVNLQGEIIGINEIGLGSMSGAIPSDIAANVVKELIEHGKVRRPWIGVEFQPLLKGQEGDGVLVSGVIPGGPADKAGVKAGDIVLAVDDEPARVHFREELPGFNARLLAHPPEKQMMLKVKRAGQDQVITVKSEMRDDAIGKEIESLQWGLTVREITTPVMKEMQRPDKHGVLVGSERSGGPANQAQPSIGAGDVIVEIGGKKVEDLESFKKITAEITEGKKEPVPTLVVFERNAERWLTLVEIGVKAPQDPTPEARKAWFPASTQVLSKKLAVGLGLKGKKGVRICQVYPESEAEKAGFQVGDIITHIDDQVVDASEPQDAQVFDDMIRGYKIGTKATFTVIRGAGAGSKGETVKIEAVLNEAPQPSNKLHTNDDMVLEFKTRDISYMDRLERRWSKDVTGAIVSHVESGGWAAVGGLHMGDVIQAVDGTPIPDVKALEAALKTIHEKRPKHIAMLVKSGIHTHFVEIEPMWPEMMPAQPAGNGK
ncbi:MAG TPA: PDZ domain-containing protein [Planctomycetota bacterium]|nr:PDZ domain-containing protein [Planctomycetota bacterium]